MRSLLSILSFWGVGSILSLPNRCFRRIRTFFPAEPGHCLAPGRPPDAFPRLTDREREILDLIARHETNPEIAKRLNLSQKTVRNHVSNIFTKLQVADRAQAVVRAREAGLD